MMPHEKAKLDRPSTGPQAIPDGGNGWPANPVRGADRGAEDLAKLFRELR